MMTKGHKYLRATSEAKRIIDEYNIRVPSQIDITALADMHGAFVKYGSISGSSARLVRNNLVGIITIRDDIVEEGRRRFAIAHEFGHFILHNSKTQLENCTESMLAQWGKNNKEESESNAFAAEILMPGNMVQAFLDVGLPSFEEIKRIASSFRTSLTSAAIRYVEISEYPCAIISSQHKKVQWYYKNPDFSRRLMPVGSYIKEHSCAMDYYNSGTVPDFAESMSGDSWLEVGSDIVINEQAIAMPAYGVVLSLIWED